MLTTWMGAASLHAVGEGCARKPPRRTPLGVLFPGRDSATDVSQKQAAPFQNPKGAAPTATDQELVNPGVIPELHSANQSHPSKPEGCGTHNDRPRASEPWCDTRTPFGEPIAPFQNPKGAAP